MLRPFARSLNLICTERARMNFEAAFVYILCTYTASVYSTVLTRQQCLTNRRIANRKVHYLWLRLLNFCQPIVLSLTQNAIFLKNSFEHKICQLTKQNVLVCELGTVHLKTVCQFKPEGLPGSPLSHILQTSFNLKSVFT